MIGCAHSSYLRSGALGAARRRWQLKRKYVAWIQKFHYVRRLLEMKISVLALDSGVPPRDASVSLASCEGSPP